MLNMEEMITITRKEYDDLKGDAMRVRYLEGTGVDNWQGYEYAYEAWKEDGMDELYGEL